MSERGAFLLPARLHRRVLPPPSHPPERPRHLLLTRVPALEAKKRNAGVTATPPPRQGAGRPR